MTTNRPNIKEIENRLDKNYRRHNSWTYKVTCLDPIVITAFATDFNKVRPNQVVPFHICDYDTWIDWIDWSSGNTPRKVVGEFYIGKCKTCGLEYKPALIIENIKRLRL